jgi:rSAM/selenodomain-associated transferase 1
MTSTIIVIAKAPVPGRVKTRLTPPLSATEAAQLAAAALYDTIDAAVATGARVVVALAGHAGSLFAGHDVAVIAQRGAGLDDRIANAFDEVSGPALLLGMDTPQVDAELLTAALHALDAHDAVLGPALDGGFWAIGVRRPSREHFVGIPMSTSITGALQYDRLRTHCGTVGLLPALRDVDHFRDAVDVAAAAPGTRFAEVLRTLTSDLMELT